MTVGSTRGGDNFKLPTIERMGGIGYLDQLDAIWVVEGGSNIRYRSTASRTTN
jgi:hypothetical protein